MWRVAGDRRWNVAVFSWNARYAHLPVSILRARRLGIGVVLWGHGYSTNHEGSYRRAYRNLLGRWADAVVTYNRGAARRLCEDGIRAAGVFGAPNALDGDAIDAAIQTWKKRPEALRDFRRHLGITDQPTALHVSRLNNTGHLRTLVDTWRLV